MRSQRLASPGWEQQRMPVQGDKTRLQRSLDDASAVTAFKSAIASEATQTNSRVNAECHARNVEFARRTDQALIALHHPMLHELPRHALPLHDRFNTEVRIFVERLSKRQIKDGTGDKPLWGLAGALKQISNSMGLSSASTASPNPYLMRHDETPRSLTNASARSGDAKFGHGHRPKVRNELEPSHSLWDHLAHALHAWEFADAAL